MLVDSAVANEFLAIYKGVLALVNDGVLPKDTKEFVECRELLYSDLESFVEYTNIPEDFKDSLRRAIYGKFIFLKKYKNWYAMKHIETSKYYAVLALTSPIEEMVEDFSVIETALVPYEGHIVCDGLIVNNNMLLGKNISKTCRDGYHQARKSEDLVRKL